MHGWRFAPEFVLSRGDDAPDLDEFTRLTRDLYVAIGEEGFWQGTFRDPAPPSSRRPRRSPTTTRSSRSRSSTATSRAGSGMVTRFAMTPRTDEGWIAAVTRHWYVDTPGPRSR